MTFRTAIARYPHTAHLFDDPDLDIQPHPTISRAFAPMVRDQAFDLSEMAIATFLMARAAGSDLVLLPVILAARPQTGALLRRVTDRFGPEDLAGRRIGVRAYSQTTALWLRGMLEDDLGLAPSACHWTTFEPAHVATYQDPPWARRAPAGADMLALLRDGTLDAAIFGNDLPDTPDLAPVFPDPAAAARSFAARHGNDPVNHMLVLRAPLAPQARAIIAKFRPQNPYPIGRPALDPAVTLANRYAATQNLIPRPLTLDEIWAGLPPDAQS